MNSRKHLLNITKVNKSTHMKSNSMTERMYKTKSHTNKRNYSCINFHMLRSKICNTKCKEEGMKKENIKIKKIKKKFNGSVKLFNSNCKIDVEELSRNGCDLSLPAINKSVM